MLEVMFVNMSLVFVCVPGSELMLAVMFVNMSLVFVCVPGRVK
jgi:hypothetical protein